MGRAGGAGLGNLFGGPSQDRLGQLGIGLQVGDHHLDRDAVMVLVPAVVVGGHGQGGVGDLGLPSQPRFGVVGHADHAAIPAAIQVRFGPARKGRSLHAEVGAAAVQLAALGHQARGGAGQHLAQHGAEGIGEADMGDGPLAEEADRPLVGAVNELVGHDHV